MKKEYHGIPDESEKANFDLTMTELKNRLKHIAGLCYALCCDISNAEFEADYLRLENAALRKLLTDAGIRIPNLEKKIKTQLRRQQPPDN